MKQILLMLAVLGIATSSVSASAFSDIAITGGFLTTEVEGSDGTTSSSSSGFFAGIHGFMELQDSFWLRSGAVLSNRGFGVGFDANNNSIDYTFMNVEAPITMMYMFNEMVGVFGGGRVGILLSEECSSDPSTLCDNTDTDFNTIWYGAELGGHFRFTPDFGIEVAYNIGLSEIAEDSDWTGGLVINAFFIF